MRSRSPARIVPSGRATIAPNPSRHGVEPAWTSIPGSRLNGSSVRVNDRGTPVGSPPIPWTTPLAATSPWMFPWASGLPSERMVGFGPSNRNSNR